MSQLAELIQRVHDHQGHYGLAYILYQPHISAKKASFRLVLNLLPLSIPLAQHMFRFRSLYITTDYIIYPTCCPS